MSLGESRMLSLLRTTTGTETSSMTGTKTCGGYLLRDHEGSITPGTDGGQRERHGGIQEFTQLVREADRHGIG